MNEFITVLWQSLLVIMLADFLAGIVHWFEDAYIRENTPLIGSFIGKANVIHHHLPRYMTRNNWWQSSWDLLCFSAAIVLGAWWLDLLTWHVWLFAVISTNANQVHKWSHQTRSENGRIITFLQKSHVLQTPHHHAVHHTNPKNVRYCPVTNLVNPILDGLRFWDGVEWILARAIGLNRQPDTSLPGNGPAPAWLNELREKSKSATT
jgi:plasmanylethanolamine desaturase